MSKIKTKITTSYGRAATINGHPTGYLYGSGYGKDKRLSRAADQAAKLLVAAFGLPVEKRGNSDGKSTGAFHDAPEGEYSETWFGLGAWQRKNGHVYYSALFRAPVAQAREIERSCGVGKLYTGPSWQPYSSVQIYRGGFRTLRAALAWLRKWGSVYCPKLSGI